MFSLNFSKKSIKDLSKQLGVYARYEIDIQDDRKTITKKRTSKSAGFKVYGKTRKLSKTTNTEVFFRTVDMKKLENNFEKLVLQNMGITSMLDELRALRGFQSMFKQAYLKSTKSKKTGGQAPKGVWSGQLLSSFKVKKDDSKHS